MSVLLPRTPAIMVVPTLKVVIFVAVHLAITELDKGEYLHTVIHQRHIQKAIRRLNRSKTEDQRCK